MSVDSTAATRASESDSDISSYSNWSVLDDSDNNSHYARKLRMGGKKPNLQSKTKVKPPKANKKFDMNEERLMMEDVLSKSSSEGSINLQYENLDFKEDVKEDSASEAFEEISPESGELVKKDSVLLYRRKNKDRLTGSRHRDMSLVQIISLIILMTSLSYITALFGSHFTAQPGALIANENLFSKIINNTNSTLNHTLDGIPILSQKDIPFNIPEEPAIVLLPPEDIHDENITKLDKQELVKAHFHNDGKVTYGPMTYKDYLAKQRNKLEAMKIAQETANSYTEKSESLSKTVSDILKKKKSSVLCDDKFKCCSLNKRLALSKRCQEKDSRKEGGKKWPSDMNLFDKSNKKAGISKKLNDTGKPNANHLKPLDALKWDFNSTRIDDIINNFSIYIKKNPLKEHKVDKLAPQPTKDNLALHKVTKNNDIFKHCLTKHKSYFNFRKIKDCFLFRLSVCMIADVIAIVIIRKLGIACIGHLRKLIASPTKSNLELQTITNKSSENKRVNMFKLLPFHRTKTRVIKKAKKNDKLICTKNQLIPKEPKMENPSDYYLFMLSLKMKALDQNMKSREDPTKFRIGTKRYSTEFKQSLIKQLSGIYKNTVKSDKLREDLVFCIMKIYECKFEYAPTSAYTTSDTLNRLDKFKTLLVDYYRYQDNPLVNTKYLKNITAKQKEDLTHVLELMLEDQKLGASRSNIECTFTADNSTFKYEAPVQQCQSAFFQKPATTQSSSNMLKSNGASCQSISNDPAYYMRERFSLLAKFWKLKQAYFTKRIQICNILKDKLSESSIAEHEGANILDGIINNALTNATTAIKITKAPITDTQTKLTTVPRNAIKVSEEVIQEVLSNVQKMFDAHRKKEELRQRQAAKVDKRDDGPPMCKRICRVNNELYRELFEKKAQAIQEKDLSRGKTLLVKTSEMTTKINLSKPYQARDPRLYKKL